MERAIDGLPAADAACPCVRSRARSCGCATRRDQGCCGGSCASAAATWCRAPTARYVLGATVEERGFELAPTAGGVYELLRDAHELVPGISELEIEELSVGLRPGTPDNAPGDRPGAVARPDLGDRALPQRHPARAAHRRARRRHARRRRRAAQPRLPTSRSSRVRARALRRARRRLGAPCEPCRGAAHDRAQRCALRRARRRDASPPCSHASALTSTRVASPLRSTARSCRARRGSRSALDEDARVEVLTAMQGG